MNILYVYDGDWPRGATRVAKQTNSLAGAGHRVLLLSRNSLRQARAESNAWMTIYRLRTVPVNAFNRLWNFPFFMNPVWVSAIWSAARKHRADCIVVSDLPLAPTAIWIARLLQIPVYYDMAEVYPEFLRDLWQYDDLGGWDRVVRNPRAAARVERYVLPRVETTFVVSEESKDRCRRMGIREDQLVLVGNTPTDIDDLVAPRRLPVPLIGLEDRPKLLFVGIVIGDRGVGLAVEATDLLRRSIPDVLLVVVGDGRDRAKVERRIAELSLQDHVVLAGWQDPTELPAYYQHCDMGLLPFLDGRHLRLTLANKLFDYMGAGLAVVAADLPPMRRILDETEAGILHEPGDARALACAAEALLKDATRRKVLGRNGREAVERKYQWGIDEQRLLAPFAFPRSDSGT